MESRFATQVFGKRSAEGRRLFGALALAAMVFTAAAIYATAAAAFEFPDRDARHLERLDFGGVVYAMTNASSGNQVLVFVRDPQGRLEAVRCS